MQMLKNIGENLKTIGADIKVSHTDNFQKKLENFVPTNLDMMKEAVNYIGLAGPLVGASAGLTYGPNYFELQGPLDHLGLTLASAGVTLNMIPPTILGIFAVNSAELGLAGMPVAFGNGLEYTGEALEKLDEDADWRYLKYAKPEFFPH
jgi:hypothetical protein